MESRLTLCKLCGMESITNGLIFSLFIIVLQTTWISGASIVGCSEGWTRHGDRCFRVSNARVSCWSAEVSCQGQGGHLASLTEGEYDFIMKNLLGPIEENVAWVGLHKNFTDRQRELPLVERREGWVWTDGTRYQERYTRWAENEPSGHLQEKCTRIENGKLCDTDMNDEHLYVCAAEIRHVTSTSSSDAAGDSGNAGPAGSEGPTIARDPGPADNKRTSTLDDASADEDGISMLVVYICVGVLAVLLVTGILVTVVLLKVKNKRKKETPTPAASYSDSTIRSTAKLTVDDISGPLPADYALARDAGWEYQEIDLPGDAASHPTPRPEFITPDPDYDLPTNTDYDLPTNPDYDLVKPVSGYDDTPDGDHYKRYIVGQGQTLNQGHENKSFQGHTWNAAGGDAVDEDYEEMGAPCDPESEDYYDMGSTVIDNVVYSMDG